MPAMIPFALAREIIKEWDGALVKSGEYGHALFGDRQNFYACAEFTLGPSNGLIISEPPLFRGCYGGTDNPLSRHVIDGKTRVQAHYWRRSKACEALLSFRTRLNGLSINDLEAKIRDDVSRKRDAAKRRWRQHKDELQDDDWDTDDSGDNNEDSPLPIVVQEPIVREWVLVSVKDDDQYDYEYNSVLPSGQLLLAKDGIIAVPLAIERID